MDKRFKQILQYVFPAVAAMLVTQLYIIVDGIFVGRGVGAAALGAVNIATPYINAIRAVSAMLTIGAASITAHAIGKNDKEKANHAFMVSLLLVLLVSVCMSVVGVVFSREIVLLSGADGIFTDMAATYLRYFCLFIAIDCAGICLTNFVRNDGQPALAFWSIIAGAVTNIFLDWLFVFPLRLGVSGAAIASGLGQITAIAILAIHFIQRKGVLRIHHVHWQAALFKDVIKRGLPELITQIGQPVTILCYNFVILHYLSGLVVSAYAIIVSLSNLIVIGVFLGISQGLQPLIGQSYGRGDIKSAHYYFRMGLMLNILCSTLIYALFFTAGKPIIALFNPDPALIHSAHSIMKIYGFSFIFASVNTVFNTYFISTKRAGCALILACGRSFIFNILFIFILPIFCGTSTIWFAVNIAEFIAVLLAIILERIHAKPTASLKTDAISIV